MSSEEIIHPLLDTKTVREQVIAIQKKHPVLMPTEDEVLLIFNKRNYEVAKRMYQYTEGYIAKATLSEGNTVAGESYEVPDNTVIPGTNQNLHRTLNACGGEKGTSQSDSCRRARAVYASLKQGMAGGIKGGMSAVKERVSDIFTTASPIDGLAADAARTRENKALRNPDSKAYRIGADMMNSVIEKLSVEEAEQMSMRGMFDNSPLASQRTKSKFTKYNGAAASAHDARIGAMKCESSGEWFASLNDVVYSHEKYGMDTETKRLLSEYMKKCSDHVPGYARKIDKVLENDEFATAYADELMDIRDGFAYDMFFKSFRDGTASAEVKIQSALKGIPFGSEEAARRALDKLGVELHGAKGYADNVKASVDAFMNRSSQRLIEQYGNKLSTEEMKMVKRDIYNLAPEVMKKWEDQVMNMNMDNAAHGPSMLFNLDEPSKLPKQMFDDFAKDLLKEMYHSEGDEGVIKVAQYMKGMLTNEHVEEAIEAYNEDISKGLVYKFGNKFLLKKHAPTVAHMKENPSDFDDLPYEEQIETRKIMEEELKRMGKNIESYVKGGIKNPDAMKIAINDIMDDFPAVKEHSRAKSKQWMMHKADVQQIGSMTLTNFALTDAPTKAYQADPKKVKKYMRDGTELTPFGTWMTGINNMTETEDGRSVHPSFFKETTTPAGISKVEMNPTEKLKVVKDVVSSVAPMDRGKILSTDMINASKSVAGNNVDWDFKNYEDKQEFIDAGMNQENFDKTRVLLNELSIRNGRTPQEPRDVLSMMDDTERTFTTDLGMKDEDVDSIIEVVRANRGAEYAMDLMKARLQHGKVDGVDSMTDAGIYSSNDGTDARYAKCMAIISANRGLLQQPYPERASDFRDWDAVRGALGVKRATEDMKDVAMKTANHDIVFSHGEAEVTKLMTELAQKRWGKVTLKDIEEFGDTMDAKAVTAYMQHLEDLAKKYKNSFGARYVNLRRGFFDTNQEESEGNTEDSNVDENEDNDAGEGATYVPAPNINTSNVPTQSTLDINTEPNGSNVETTEDVAPPATNVGLPKDIPIVPNAFTGTAPNAGSSSNGVSSPIPQRIVAPADQGKVIEGTEQAPVVEQAPNIIQEPELPPPIYDADVFADYGGAITGKWKISPEMVTKYSNEFANMNNSEIALNVRDAIETLRDAAPYGKNQSKGVPAKPEYALIIAQYKAGMQTLMARGVDITKIPTSTPEDRQNSESFVINDVIDLYRKYGTFRDEVDKKVAVSVRYAKNKKDPVGDTTTHLIHNMNVLISLTNLGTNNDEADQTMLDIARHNAMVSVAADRQVLKLPNVKTIEQKTITDTEPEDTTSAFNNIAKHSEFIPSKELIELKIDTIGNATSDPMLNRGILKFFNELESKGDGGLIEKMAIKGGVGLVDAVTQKPITSIDEFKATIRERINNETELLSKPKLPETSIVPKEEAAEPMGTVSDADEDEEDMKLGVDEFFDKYRNDADLLNTGEAVEDSDERLFGFMNDELNGKKVDFNDANSIRAAYPGLSDDKIIDDINWAVYRAYPDINEWYTIEGIKSKNDKSLNRAIMAVNALMSNSAGGSPIVEDVKPEEVINPPEPKVEQSNNSIVAGANEAELFKYGSLGFPNEERYTYSEDIDEPTYRDAVIRSAEKPQNGGDVVFVYGKGRRDRKGNLVGVKGNKIVINTESDNKDENGNPMFYDVKVDPERIKSIGTIRNENGEDIPNDIKSSILKERKSRELYAKAIVDAAEAHFNEDIINRSVAIKHLQYDEGKKEANKYIKNKIEAQSFRGVIEPERLLNEAKSRHEEMAAVVGGFYSGHGFYSNLGEDEMLSKLSQLAGEKDAYFKAYNTLKSGGSLNNIEEKKDVVPQNTDNIPEKTDVDIDKPAIKLNKNDKGFFIRGKKELWEDIVKAPQLMEDKYFKSKYEQYLEELDKMQIKPTSEDISGRIKANSDRLTKNLGIVSPSAQLDVMAKTKAYINHLEKQGVSVNIETSPMAKPKQPKIKTKTSQAQKLFIKGLTDNKFTPFTARHMLDRLYSAGIEDISTIDPKWFDSKLTYEENVKLIEEKLGIRTHVKGDITQLDKSIKVSEARMAEFNAMKKAGTLTKEQEEEMNEEQLFLESLYRDLYYMNGD